MSEIYCIVKRGEVVGTIDSEEILTTSELDELSESGERAVRFSCGYFDGENFRCKKKEYEMSVKQINDGICVCPHCIAGIGLYHLKKIN